MSEEWGPWVEHDGKGCPVLEGVIVEAFGRHSCGKCENFIGPARDYWIGWRWAHGTKILRYRIRKPKGLTILEGVLREVEREGEAA